MSTQQPVKTSLPSLPASAAPDMRMYLERVREELSRVQAGVTNLTVITSGSGSGGGTPGTPGTPGGPALPCGSPVTPTAPTGFQVTAGFNFFMVEWDSPGYCGHDHTEVYGTKDNSTQGTEVLLGTSEGTIFSLAEPGMGVRRCFWARHVNVLGEKGPFNATEGTCDVTALDPGYILNVLTGQITATHLYKSLGEKIEQLPQFDVALQNLDSAIGQLAEGVTDITVETDDQCLIDGVNDPAYTTAETCVAAGGMWVAGSIATLRGLKQTTDTALAAIAELNTVTATSTSANARRTAGLKAQINIADNKTLTAYVVDQGEAWANGEGALGQRISGVEARVGSRPNIVPNSNFEQGMEGVSASHTAFAEAGGAYGRAVVMSNAPVGAAIIFPLFTVNAGEQITGTLDANLYSVGGTGGAWSFLRFYTTNTNPFAQGLGSTSGTVVVGSVGFSDVPSARDRFLVSATAPAGTVYAALGFYLNATCAQVKLRRPQVCAGAAPLPAYSSEAAGILTAGKVINVEVARIGYCTKNGATTSAGDKWACEAAGGVWNQGMPWATAVKQVSVTAPNGQTATVQQQFEAIYGANGLRAQYTVKIDAGGKVSGFGLASEPAASGGTTTSFGVRADRFYIAAPESTGSSITSVPFIVTTTDSYDENGNIYPAGVYITDAYIKGAAITSAKIRRAAITTAKIADLAVETAKIKDLAVDTLKIAGYAVTVSTFKHTSRGAFTLGSGPAQILYNVLSPLSYYTYSVSGLPSGEAAGTIFVAQTTIYPPTGDTARRIIAVNLLVDGVFLSGAADVVQAEPMSVCIAGYADLYTGTHTVQLIAYVENAAPNNYKSIGSTESSVTIMSGKR